MNPRTQKTIATALLLGLFTYANLSTANSINGTLGSALGATDFYRVTCSKNANGDTDKLKVSVLDLAPVLAPIISVQVVKGILVTNTTDAVDADAATSPAVLVKGGNGGYDLRVNKTAATAAGVVESYTLNYTCVSSTGKVTGTAIKIAQNQ